MMHFRRLQSLIKTNFNFALSGQMLVSIFSMILFLTVVSSAAMPTCVQLFTELKLSKTPAKVKATNVQNLAFGQKLKLSSGRIVEFLSLAGEGTFGVVLKVRSESGQLYALKLPKKTDTESLRTFQHEPMRMTGAESAGFKTAKLIESRKDYHLKEWIDGQSAHDWFKNWVTNGFDRNDPKLIQLRKLLRVSAERGLYTFDLNRHNLIWTDQWVVIDCERTTTEYGPEKAFERYHTNISQNWAREFVSKDSYYFIKIRDEFQRALTE